GRLLSAPRTGAGPALQRLVIDLAIARGGRGALDLAESLAEPEDVLATHPRLERHGPDGRRLPEQHKGAVPEALDLGGRQRDLTFADLERCLLAAQTGQNHVMRVTSRRDEHEDRGEIEATQHRPRPHSPQATKACLVPVLASEVGCVAVGIHVPTRVELQTGGWPVLWHPGGPQELRDRRLRARRTGRRGW